MDDHHRKSRTREHSSHRRHHRTVAAGEKAVHGSHYATPDGKQAPISRPVPVHHILREQVQEPLANEEDYVHRWLAKTVAEVPEVDSHKSSRHERATDLHVPSKNTTAKIPTFPKFLQNKAQDAQAMGIDDDRKGTDRRVCLETSSGSSFLERGHAPEPKTPRNQIDKAIVVENEFEIENEVRAKETRKRKRSSSPVIEVQSDSSDHRPKETFSRRARHKTKEDRYEPKKKTEKPKKGKASHSKREKKGQQSKMSKVAGDTLMQNFESNKVGNDRLTIRPSHKLGLFKNGRASSPGRRRGVPDLAFSEMEFLQRPNRGVDHRPQKAPPKQRHKDRRREERIFNEISSFFNAAKEPLGEIDPNQAHLDRSSVGGNPDKVYKQPHRGQTRTDSNHEETLTRQGSLPDFPEFSQKPFLGFGRQASLPTKNRTFPRETADRVADTASRVSGPVTTYLSWSESGVSPDDAAEPGQRQYHNEQERSPTPDSVRQALAKTGIFKDTGLRRYLFPSEDSLDIRARFRELQQDADRASKSGEASPQKEAPSSPQKRRSSIKGSYVTADMTSNDSRPKPSIDLSRQQTKFDLSKFRADIPQPTIEVSRTPAKAVQRSGKTRPGVEIYHFDPEIGWHQGKEDHAQVNIHGPVQDPTPPESARPNRQEAAQAAYIRPHSRSALKESEIYQARKDVSEISRFPVRPQTLIRPNSAPAGMNVPEAIRPHSAPVTTNTGIPNQEVRELAQKEQLDNINDQALPGGESQQQTQPDRSTGASSLPPLTDHVSVSSLMRTLSTPSTKNGQVREQLQKLQNQFPEKPHAVNPGDFGLPVRGAWRRQDNESHPIHRVSPSVVIADSLYGQQIEEMPLNDFQNVAFLSPALNGDLRANYGDDLDYAREEAFIQGLSYETDANQNMVQYQDNGYLEPADEAMTNIADFADNSEYYDHQQYFDENTRPNFRDDGYEEQEMLEGYQEDAFPGNERDRDLGYGVGSYQPYREDELFRPDMVEMDEGGESLTGFWRPHRQY